MNKTFHSIWNASKQAYVAAAETVSARGKPSSGVKVAAVMASLMGSLLGTVANAQTAPPPLSSTALPTSGQVSAGQASISQNGAHMVINQSTQRAAINWQTFNVGKDAHVQFQQPSAASVTLNRVMSSDPSQIFGRISANGQVVLTNPAGVYFGKDARVDVGGLVATTHGMSDADFMAGKNRYERNGSTGSVVNEGELKAALGGYIALLAPEVRNQGAVIAQMGTVALAAGEAIDLKFDSHNRLTSLRVEPSQMAALVENKHAVQAPGGLVIISAQSMDRLVGGVVRNSGRIEANGLQQQGGRIMLSASTRVDNSGSISANATAGNTAAVSGPAGKVEISAPEVLNSGSISATGLNTATAQHSAGNVLVQATHFTQTATGNIDLSAPSQGGQLKIETTGNVSLQGSVNVQATQDRTHEGTATQGGTIDIAAQGDIELNSATLDASGGQGGTIALRAKAPSQPNNPQPAPDAPGQGRLAIMGNSTLSTRGRSGQGGGNVLLGEHISLLDKTRIDAMGTTGGGQVLVGGDWQGGQNADRRVFDDPHALYQATTVTMAQGASIDASATENGHGGTVVLWSDIANPNSATLVYGALKAQGGAQGGNGGQIETSGFYLDAVPSYVSASAPKGQNGEWLLDPYNIIIASSSAAGTAFSAAGGSYTYTPGLDSTILASSIVTALNAGTNVTVSTGLAGSPGASLGNISVNSDITASTVGGGSLTLTAANHINLNANIATYGTIEFNGAVRVQGADRTVTSSNGHLNFNSTIDSFDSKVQGLSLTASAGGILLGGSIGSINPIFNLSINSNQGAVFTGSEFVLAPRDTRVYTTEEVTNQAWVEIVKQYVPVSRSSSTVRFSSIGSISYVNIGYTHIPFTFDGNKKYRAAVQGSSDTGIDAIVQIRTVGKDFFGNIRTNTVGETTLTAEKSYSLISSISLTSDMSVLFVHTNASGAYGVAPAKFISSQRPALI